MTSVMCICQGVDDRTPCEHPITQEDLACDHCREHCFSEDGQRFKAEYQRRFGSPLQRVIAAEAAGDEQARSDALFECL